MGTDTFVSFRKIIDPVALPSGSHSDSASTVGRSMILSLSWARRELAVAKPKQMRSGKRTLCVTSLFSTTNG
jgi:hypothetical protein